MKVEPSTRQLAVRQIFRACGKASGGSLAASELQRAWIRTGLRWADLQLALRELIQQRVLESHTVRGSVRLQVTTIGQREFGAPPHDFATLILDWVRLQRLRLRKARPRAGPTFRKRRRYDRSRG